MYLHVNFKYNSHMCLHINFSQRIMYRRPISRQILNQCARGNTRR